MTRVLRILLATVGIIVLVALGLVGVATADPFPDPDSGTNGPDKGAHTFCFHSSFTAAALVNRARYSMDNNDGVEAMTDVNTTEKAACAPAIDVHFHTASIGDDAYGMTLCHIVNSIGRCDQWRVWIDWNHIKAVATNDGYQARKTICHEIGHTLGVRHYSGTGGSPDGSAQSCMISGLYDSGAAWTRQYGNHHRAHVNSWW